MKKESTQISFAKLVLLSIVAAFAAMVLGSCNSLKKSYNKVAANIPASEANKAKLGGWVAFHFPNQEKTIIKDSTIEKIIVSKVTDTITNVVDNTIYKYIYNRDTLVVERWKNKTVTVKDTVGNFAKWLEFKAVSDSFSKYKGDNYILKDQLIKANIKVDAAEKKQHKLLWLLILVAAVGFASHYLRSKLKF